MVGWHPGDLSASGLGLTACYLSLAGACFLIAYRQDGGPYGRRRSRNSVRHTVWNVLGAMFLFVSIERQLGLFDLVTDLMRAKAEMEGNYASRRATQLATLKVVAIAAVPIGAMFAALAARAGRHAASQATLVTIMIAYMIIKAISLHAVDRLLSQHIAHIAVGNWIELGLVGIAAGIVMLALSVSPGDRPHHRQVR